MNISTYIDETIQQSQDFLDDEYVKDLGLTKPSKLVFKKAKNLFINISKKIYNKYPNDNYVDLILKENGSMIVSWHSNDFNKKYVIEINEVIESNKKILKISLNKNFDLNG